PSKSDPPYMDISVKDLAGLDIQRALTGGIPIAEGAAPKGSQFVLLDHNDQPVPCQTEVLATWEEGSARWVLLDFQAKPQAMGKEHSRLTWNTDAGKTLPTEAVNVSEGKSLSIGSGNIQLKT